MKTYKEFINENKLKIAKVVGKAAIKAFSNLSKYSKVKPLSGIKPKTAGQLYQGMKAKPLKPGTKIIDKLDANVEKSVLRRYSDRGRSAIGTSSKIKKQLGSKTIGGEKVGEVLPKSKMPKFDYEKELLKQPGMSIEKVPLKANQFFKLPSKSGSYTTTLIFSVSRI